MGKASEGTCHYRRTGEYLIAFRVGARVGCDGSKPGRSWRVTVGGDYGRGGITFILSSESSIMSRLLSEDCLNSLLASPLNCVIVESDLSFVPQPHLYFPVVIEKILRESKEWKWKGPCHRAWHRVSSTSSLFLSVSWGICLN